MRLGAALVLVSGALLVAAPGLISSWARARAEEAIGARIDGSASIAELRVGLNGKVRLSGLEVTDATGQLVALVPEARFDLGIRSLLLGKRDIALRVTGVQVELVQGEDGRWNVAELLRADGTAEPGEAGGREREPLPETPPEPRGTARTARRDGHRAQPRSVLELRDVHLRVGLDGDAREFSVEGGARLAGGDGDAGTFLLDGALWPDARAGLRIDEVSLRGLELGAVQEALHLVGRPLDEGSRLAGDVDLVAHGSFAGFDPAGRFGFEAELVGRDVDVAVVEDGERAFAFEDREPRASVAVQRALVGAQPTAILDLNARGGDIVVQGGWDGAAEPAISAAVSMRDVEASTGLDRWIARVHPALASAAAIEGTAVEGLVSTDVAVSYDGALRFEDLLSGAPAFDLPGRRRGRSLRRRGRGHLVAAVLRAPHGPRRRPRSPASTWRRWGSMLREDASSTRVRGRGRSPGRRRASRGRRLRRGPRTPVGRAGDGGPRSPQRPPPLPRG